MERLPLIVPTAAAGQATVAESLHLLRFPPGTPEVRRKVVLILLTSMSACDGFCGA